MTINIEYIFAKKIGFASHQNAVPILRKLELVNQSGSPPTSEDPSHKTTP
jgi:hypothetical protein